MTESTRLSIQPVADWTPVHPCLFSPNCQCTPRHPNNELAHCTLTLVPSRRPFVALLPPWDSHLRPLTPSLSSCRGCCASIDARVRHLDVGACMSTFTHLLHLHSYSIPSPSPSPVPATLTPHLPFVKRLQRLTRANHRLDSVSQPPRPSPRLDPFPRVALAVALDFASPWPTHAPSSPRHPRPRVGCGVEGSCGSDSLGW